MIDKVLYISLLQEMTEDEFVKFMSFTPKEQEQVYRLWTRQLIEKE